MYYSHTPHVQLMTCRTNNTHEINQINAKTQIIGQRWVCPSARRRCLFLLSISCWYILFGLKTRRVDTLLLSVCVCVVQSLAVDLSAISPPRTLIISPALNGECEVATSNAQSIYRFFFRNINKVLKYTNTHKNTLGDGGNGFFYFQVICA